MEIGSKIKALRLQCNLTQQELADRSELTKGFISQLENDLTSPSISTLTDILGALGTDLKNFFSEDSNDQVVFKEGDYFESVTDAHTITWIVPNAQKNEMEPIIIDIEPMKSTTKDMPHEGEEFGYVLSGACVLNIGSTKHRVKKGETFYFASNKVHYIENTADKACKILWISSPPQF